MRRTSALVAVALVLAACGDNEGDDAGPTAYFDLDGVLDGNAEVNTFWDLPWPSDLRLTPSGAPDLERYPNPRTVPILTSLLSAAADRKGWPTMPAIYVRFTAPVSPRTLSDVIAADDPAVALLDIDPDSPDRGARYPLVALTVPEDSFVPSNLVVFAPRQGIVLRADTTYALVVRTAFAPGFRPARAFAQLAGGETPPGARGAAAAQSYAPLWPALADADIAADDVLVASVFTTGDETARLRTRSDAARPPTPPAIDNLALSNGATFDGFCSLTGTITLPQFQRGTPPFDDDGRFVLDDADTPTVQGTATVPVAITIPKGAMPASGWPLFQWIHGSGGSSNQLVDRGRTATSTGMPEPGKGPGWVVARHGIAGATSAMPLNPQRLPGATDYEYINIGNLGAFPYTFQQGVIEQRVFLDALLALQIPQTLLDACGNTAPAGGMHFFDATKIMAGGQSMGGMYTNMTAAVEPRWGALVPTGAGGFWNFMILETELVPGAKGLLAGALGVDEPNLVFVHPGMQTLALAWEAAEPIVYMNRINQRPLAGLPPRHVYQSLPEGDENFTTAVYDAAALAYGNQQAGEQLWPTLQPALALASLDGIVAYPVTGNLDGATRIAVQFAGDGIIDPHYIFAQLDEVKHQYGCFLATYVRDGVPTVPAPGALDDPCE